MSGVGHGRQEGDQRPVGSHLHMVLGLSPLWQIVHDGPHKPLMPSLTQRNRFNHGEERICSEQIVKIKNKNSTSPRNDRYQNIYLAKHDLGECFPQIDLLKRVLESLGLIVGECGLNILVGDILNVVNAIHEDHSILHGTNGSCGLEGNGRESFV